MTDYSPAMMIVVIVVAFIAGYSIVSYAVRKFREAGRAGRRDQDQQGSDTTTNDASVPKSWTDEDSERSHHENR